MLRYEKIRVITPVDNLEATVRHGSYTSFYDGWKIETDQQSIFLLMEREQECCEHFGFFWCEDKLSDFFGARILSIELTDPDLSTTPLAYLNEKQDGIDEVLNTMFVTIKTDRGDLQFAAYNAHNGYYGHEARIISAQLNHAAYL